MKAKLLIVILSLLIACSSKPYAVKHPDMPVAAGHEKIYIVSHGWHTGFVVPAKKIQNQLPELRKRFGDILYIEFGWGDKDFYQAEEVTTGITLKAVLWPTESVIHAVALPEKPDRYFANSMVETLCLSGKEYSSLLRFISESFYKDEHGEILKYESGIYGNSQFYKGVGNFYLMNTCNKWTAKGLKSAGMDISPTFKLTAGSIMDYLKHYRQSQEMGSNENSNTRQFYSTPSECR
ncbi:MAG: TIGR02117 family protein [Gammaproteobacteria bacterium]|nr:TIGR02117 family protein [Gammaproteobacteria bacterium]